MPPDRPSSTGAESKRLRVDLLDPLEGSLWRVELETLDPRNESEGTRAGMSCRLSAVSKLANPGIWGAEQHPGLPLDLHVRLADVRASLFGVLPATQCEKRGACSRRPGSTWSGRYTVNRTSRSMRPKLGSANGAGPVFGVSVVEAGGLASCRSLVFTASGGSSRGGRRLTEESPPWHVVIGAKQARQSRKTGLQVVFSSLGRVLGFPLHAPEGRALGDAFVGVVFLANRRANSRSMRAFTIGIRLDPPTRKKRSILRLPVLACRASSVS